MARGTKLAIGIVLLWLGGFALFVAFESGKTPSLATAPRDVPELAAAIATTTQRVAGTGQTGAGG